MSGYNPRRPLLGAFINGISAQAFTMFLPREEVARRSQRLSKQLREQLLDDWDAMAEAARLFKDRQAENHDEPPRPQPTERPSTEDPAHDGLYSVKTVAVIIDRSERRVRQLRDYGELEGVMVHDRWMITEESIGDYGMRQLVTRQSD